MYVSFGAAFAFTTMVLLGLMSGRSKKRRMKTEYKSQARGASSSDALQQTASENEEVEGRMAVEGAADEDVPINQSQAEQKKLKYKKNSGTKVRKRARHVAHT
eukprot:IDg21219t1